MSDSLQPIFVPPFLDKLKKLEDLASGSNRAFLIGAGCSVCAGLPLMRELTRRVAGSPSLGTGTKGILDSVSQQFEGATNVTIEDFMSEIVDLLAIAERRKERGANHASVRLGGT